METGRPLVSVWSGGGGGQWCVCVDAIKTGATRAVRGETRGRVERVQAGSGFPQPSPSIFSLSRALSLVFTTLGKRITQGRTLSFSLSRVMQRESKGRHNQHHGTGGVIVPAGLPACLFVREWKKSVRTERWKGTHAHARAHAPRPARSS